MNVWKIHKTILVDIVKINKRIIKTLGARLSFAIAINFYLWLFVAMTNDNEVTIYFNHFNEAGVEIVMYLALLPIILYGFYLELKEHHKKKKAMK